MSDTCILCQRICGDSTAGSGVCMGCVLDGNVKQEIERLRAELDEIVKCYQELTGIPWVRKTDDSAVHGWDE